MRRLENLQTELNKTITDLDRFWGLLIDGSVAFRQVGENAKPMVDRICQIIDVVWRVKVKVEGLPSNTPLELPRGDTGE